MGFFSFMREQEREKKVRDRQTDKQTRQRDRESEWEVRIMQMVISLIKELNETSFFFLHRKPKKRENFKQFSISHTFLNLTYFLMSMWSFSTLTSGLTYRLMRSADPRTMSSQDLDSPSFVNNWLAKSRRCSIWASLQKYKHCSSGKQNKV